MQTRRIGSLEVSVVGLGCNNFGMRVEEAGTAAVVHAALETGINFFDTADVYGGTKSEEFLGRALREHRDAVLIATKFGIKLDDQRPGGGRPEYVRSAAEDSLRRLGTDRIDLYQMHRPDPDVPIAETLGALHELVQAGKVREIGCSNFSAEQLREAEAAAAGKSRFVSVQNEYSLLHRDPEQGVLAECERLGLAFLPYFPLASGLLTGKYQKGQPAPPNTRLAKDDRFSGMDSSAQVAQMEALRQFAEARHHTLLELAFSWLLTRRAVASVIAGATKPEQVKANAAAVHWSPSTEDLAEIDRILSAQAA